MTSTKYIGMDVHKESISIAVRNSVGKVVMESVIETKANIILDFIHGLRGELQVTFEEGTWATRLYDLLNPHVTKLVVCDPRKNARQGNKNDQIDARELSEPVVPVGLLFEPGDKSACAPQGHFIVVDAEEQKESVAR